MPIIWLTSIAIIFIFGAFYFLLRKPKSPEIKQQALQEISEESNDHVLPEEINPALVLVPDKPQVEDEDQSDARDDLVHSDIFASHPTWSSLNDEKQHLLNTLTHAIPELPHISLNLLPVLSQPGAGTAEVAKIIDSDQASAARLLRLINSSFYGLEHKVDSLHRAITLLGLDIVRSTVVFDSFNRVIQPKGIDGMDAKVIWRQCAAVSVTAKHLARSARGVEPEVAATAGLLHNIGYILLLTTERKHLIAAREKSIENNQALITFEDEYIGFNHQAWGECFIRQWGLPEVIATAVGSHHNPMAEPFNPLAAIVWLSDYVVSRMGYACPITDRLHVEEEQLKELTNKLGIHGNLGGYISDGLLRQIKSATYVWDENKDREKAYR